MGIFTTFTSESFQKISKFHTLEIFAFGKDHTSITVPKENFIFSGKRVLLEFNHQENLCCSEGFHELASEGMMPFGCELDVAIDLEM